MRASSFALCYVRLKQVIFHYQGTPDLRVRIGSKIEKSRMVEIKMYVRMYVCKYVCMLRHVNADWGEGECTFENVNADLAILANMYTIPRRAKPGGDERCGRPSWGQSPCKHCFACVNI